MLNSVSRREFLQAGAMAMASTNIAAAQGGAATAPLPVKALVFDTFGTVVDWRSPVAREALRPALGRDPRRRAGSPLQTGPRGLSIRGRYPRSETGGRDDGRGAPRRPARREASRVADRVRDQAEGVRAGRQAGSERRRI